MMFGYVLIAFLGSVLLSKVVDMLPRLSSDNSFNLGVYIVIWLIMVFAIRNYNRRIAWYYQPDQKKELDIEEQSDEIDSIHRKILKINRESDGIRRRLETDVLVDSKYLGSDIPEVRMNLINHDHIRLQELKRIKSKLEKKIDTLANDESTELVTSDEPLVKGEPRKNEG